jgi:tetratricopeptide (TPR) repeat protein
MNPIQSSLNTLLLVTLLGSPVVATNGWAQENAADGEKQEQVATKDVKTEAQIAAEARLPKIDLTPKIFYQVLLAEISGNRGSNVLATSTYLELARTTRDPRIAKRAVEVSLHARQADGALEAAQIWADADPESPQAQQTLASLLLGAQRLDEAERHLAKFLTITPPPAEQDEPNMQFESPHEPAPAAGNLVDRLENVTRMLLRYPDKTATLRLIEHLTAPYENLPEAHFSRAMAAANAGDDARALKYLDRAQELRPDWEESLLFKVQLQQRTSTSLAEETLRKFLAEHPKSGDVRLAYARALIGDKHYEEARREFSTLLADYPDKGEVLYAVALLSLQLNDYGPAEIYLKQLLDLKFGNLNLLRFYLGQIAEETKRQQEALQWYEMVTPGEQYPLALSHAASLLARQGKVEDGRELLHKGAETMPSERLTLLIAEAQLLSDFKRETEAFDLLDKELVSHPEEPDLLYESALLAEKLNRLDVLERNLHKLIQLKPDDARAYNALGYSLADRSLRLDEAQQMIDKALSLAPNDAYIIDSKGWLLYRRGETAAAIETLRKAFDMRPDPEIAAHLGELLWTTGKREEARKTWNDAVKLSPTNQVLTDTINKFKP